MEGRVTADEGYKPDLAALKRMVEDFQSLTYDGRRNSTIDIDYLDGNQLTDTEKAALRKRKQPDVVFNRVRPAVLGTLGVLKQGETDPRAYPRNPQDEDSADVASKTLRFIADKARFDDLRIKVAKDYLTPGTGACLIGVDPDDQNITVDQVRWEEFIYDPRARREDFKDARYMGIMKWQWVDDLKRKFPGKEVELEAALNTAPFAVDDMFDDRPKDAQTTWADKKKRRVLTIELYHEEGGKWYRCYFHASGILESGESVYLDEKGRPGCPIEAVSCFIDRENNRYGIVRDMRPLQDEINKRRSKALHMLNTRQVQESQPGMGMGDLDVVRAEAARPDGVLPSGWQIITNSDVLQGQISLMQQSIAEIERMGPNPAVLGRQGADASGRAQLVRQQAGLTEQAIVFSGIEDWELRVYRQMWVRARQFWTAPMYVRITDDEGAPEFIGVNQPEVGFDPMTGQQVVLGYKNRLAELDVDITIDSVPDTVNIQQEQFQMLTELAKMYGPQEVPFEDILETSTMPNKRQVIERRKARQEQAAQAQSAPDPRQQMAERGMIAEISKTEAEAALTGAKAQNEMLKPQIEAANALIAAQNPPPGYPGASPFVGA
jgi:hypothetical protein